ncbi:tectonic-3-like [Montipora capricornis]|uniref:tectonic-3-like n=1 Tax=Montipora capricornis TaxID=246305 RepID=UPI0035F1B278
MGRKPCSKMAAVLGLFTVCSLLPSFLVSTLAQSNGTLFSPSSSSVEGCTCDLTGNGCDVNCCCDVDCSAEDQEAFTECKDEDLNRDDRVCVSSALLFAYRRDTQFRTETTGTGLFCIIRDNYESRNFYNDVQTASTEEEFSNLKSQAASVVYDYVDEKVDQASSSVSSYKVGDPVLLIFDSGARGFLSLPKPLFGNECDDNNPAGYREDESTECTRTITELASECETSPVINAKSNYQGFKVAKVFSSSSLSVLNTSSSTNISNSSVGSSDLLNVTVAEPLLCQTSLGIPNTCPFAVPPNPTYDTQNNRCDNIALEVSYNVQYSNSSTDIVAVMVEFVLGSVTSERGLDLSQKVSVSFSKAGATDVTFRRSGNPGYIVGEPLVAGRLVTVDEKDAIFLSSDRNTWLTIISPSVDGSCSNSSERTSVTFGVDMRTGCTISLPLDLRVSQCQLIQEVAFNTILGDQPTYVASFGNSDVNSVGDWVKILNSRPANEAVQGKRQCRNMRLGLHIEVLFAYFGFLAKPQPRIVGVLFKYDDTRDIQYQCTGAQCQPGSRSPEQQVEVVTSVGFVDVSDKPIEQVKPRPTFEAKASSDFFFPFF